MCTWYTRNELHRPMTNCDETGFNGSVFFRRICCRHSVPKNVFAVIVAVVILGQSTENHLTLTNKNRPRSLNIGLYATRVKRGGGAFLSVNMD